MNNPLEHNFNKILASFKATLTQDESENFRFATLDDLKQTVAEIQAEQGSARRLQNLRRLDAFLEAMEQYDKVVQIFLNAADLLAFIWGPAKFMLMTASTWADSFNTLLDAYEEIGDHIPLLKQYEDIMERSPELQIVLELIYKDILNFHQRAIRHFKNKVWKKLFHATWKTFRTDFQAVLRSLQSHKRLLDSQGILVGVQGILVGVQEIQRVRDEIENERRQRQQDEETRRRREVFIWLAAADSAEDQETASEARSKYPTTGHWILQETLVAKWCDAQSQTEPFLWINGKPGAGKTVLGSVLIEECANISNTNLAYFYCRAEDCNRNTFIGACRSLICQLAQRNTSILSYVYEKSASSGRSQLDSISLAKEMLGVIFDAFDTLFIIIDGIDECQRIEKERISSTLISIVESHTAFLRCCFISQHDKDTGKIFRSMPTFQITEKHNEGDILAYCVGMEERIASRFQVSATDLQHLNISRNVAAKADGMFLLAKLVMENLLQQCSLADLEAEIENIPPDLDKAYSRLLSRILHDAPLPEQRVAKRLLCWLLCTQRPLRWHEIQGAMSIDIKRLIFDYRRSLVNDSKTFCGSLIEVRKSGTIELVHQTARSFLEKQEELQLGPEEVNFTCICLANLTLPSHDDDNSEDSIRDYIHEGYYGLSDYSVIYWQEHLNKTILEKELDTRETLTAFNAVIHPFLSRRFTAAPNTTNRSANPTPNLSRFKSEIFYPRLLQAVAYTKSEPASLSTSKRDCRPVVPQLLKVRDIMESVFLEADSHLKARLQTLYGPNIFKCPESHCSFFHEGFSIASVRNAHRDKHRRAFVCTYPGCHALIGFATQAELNKHNVNYHGDAVDKLSFPWNGNVASIDIEKQIKDGNLSEVQAWADQWEPKIPVERLWFSTARRGFEQSPLGLAIRSSNMDIFEALFSRAPDDLFTSADGAISQSTSPKGHLFADIMRNGNEEIAVAYLRMLGTIDVSLFERILSLSLGEDMIALFLSHAATSGDKKFKVNALLYLNAAVEREHEASTRYILFDSGLWEELHRGPWNSELDDLGVKGHFKFLIKILPELGKSPLMINTRLHQCCREDDSRQVADLLQNENVEPNRPDKRGHTPWIVATRNWNSEAIRQLLGDPRVVIHACQDAGRTDILHWAVFLEHTACVELLLSEGIPVRELTRKVWIDGSEKSAIELAKTSSAPGVRSLLEAYLNEHWPGWNSHSQHSQKSTTLIQACITADLSKVQNALRRAPNDLDAPDSEGMTPFLQAVNCGMHQIVHFLLEQGCHTHCSTGLDRTSPLMLAVSNEDLEMVRLLLSKAGVDPTYKDEKGKSALDYLNPDSLVAEDIRNDIQDAIDVALLFQDEIEEHDHEGQDAMGMALLFQDFDG